MTEDEAKTKWCPMVRHTPATESHHAFDNREEGLGNPAARCIGSACMAWRWDKPSDLPMDPEAWKVPTSGHCGLARAPV